MLTGSGRLEFAHRASEENRTTEKKADLKVGLYGTL
jgi:hypothetical protein